MKLYHQTGFRYQWNLDSYHEDHAGDGLIFSPVNIESAKLQVIDKKTRTRSFLDPQLYLPKDLRGAMSTHGYFPVDLKEDFRTDDFGTWAPKIARLCTDYQIQNGFEYVIIPARHFEELPNDHLDQQEKYFVDPFVTYLSDLGTDIKVLITVIAKPIQLRDSSRMHRLLNWVTDIQGIDGVYLIFENKFTTKQIKDATYLGNALEFVDSLRRNELEVHIGYTNTEGILYSAACPESISMGSYENLRCFSVERFREDRSTERRGPTARLYSGELLQWISHGYIGAIQKLYGNIGDELVFNRSMLQYNSVPNTVIPSDQKAYLEFLYGSLPSGKEGNIFALEKIAGGAYDYINP